MLNSPLTDWSCPACGRLNTDHFESTVLMCTCGHTESWDTVTPEAEMDFTDLPGQEFGEYDLDFFD